VGQERLAARLRPTRVAIAMVMTKPPTISGSHVSIPVRAVVRAAADDDARDELELPVLELLLVFELLFEFELDCAAATPASDSVITTPRNKPAITRRATAPVVRTMISLPKRVCGWLEFRYRPREILPPSADHLREHHSRHSIACKVSRDPTQPDALPGGPGRWHHSR
jgi:hypothetical protein